MDRMRASERRTAPRTELELACTLHRHHGSPIDARTVDVGPGGMSVACHRPLAVDELLAFDLASGGQPVHGQARVLRQHGHELYALRFEQVGEPTRAGLERLARAG